MPPTFKSAAEIQSDFGLFRSAVPLKKANLPNREEVWGYYTLGADADDEDGRQNDTRQGEGSGSSLRDLVVFIPGTSTGAESFFYQLDALSCKGYRCVALQYPPYYSVDEWVDGFDLFLDVLGETTVSSTQGSGKKSLLLPPAGKVHLFGNSLGGFLAQAYCAERPKRVASLMLCNSFSSTASFADQAAGMVGLVHVMPTAALRKFMLDGFPTDQQIGRNPAVQSATDWVATRLEGGESLDGYDLAGRISLTYTLASVGNLRIEPDRILIIDVNDQCVTTSSVRQELKDRYPDAKQALLKTGGDFPHLSQVGEINLFVEVHLRNCGCFPFKEEVERRASEGPSNPATQPGAAGGDEFSAQAASNYYSTGGGASGGSVQVQQSAGDYYSSAGAGGVQQNTNTGNADGNGYGGARVSGQGQFAYGAGAGAGVGAGVYYSTNANAAGAPGSAHSSAYGHPQPSSSHSQPPAAPAPAVARDVFGDDPFADPPSRQQSLSQRAPPQAQAAALPPQTASGFSSGSPTSGGRRAPSLLPQQPRRRLQRPRLTSSTMTTTFLVQVWVR